MPWYLSRVYWWAYVDPRAITVFERQWLVNAILWGNFGRLRDAALDALGNPLTGRTLQIACVYGDLTRRLAHRIAPGGILDVVDVLPLQLANLRRKLPEGHAVAWCTPTARHWNTNRKLRSCAAVLSSARTTCGGAAGDARAGAPRGAARRSPRHRRLSPAARPQSTVLAHGGHPETLEPFALDLWANEIETWLPETGRCRSPRRTFFGGLYQIVTLTV